MLLLPKNLTPIKLVECLYESDCALNRQLTPGPRRRIKLCANLLQHPKLVWKFGESLTADLRECAKEQLAPYLLLLRHRFAVF